MCRQNLILLSVICTVWLLQAGAEEPSVSPTEYPAEPVIMERSSHHVSPTYKGFWRKKFSWRPRWVKTWQPKKVYVAVWKRMWGPVEVNEWVPVPKPPPGWAHQALGPVFVKKIAGVNHVTL